MPDELDQYDYDLPGELIARQPAARREAARLLVVERQTGRIDHRTVADLPELLNTGDCLVLNDTRVLKARLLGRRRQTGGRWEGLFLEATASGSWKVLCQTRGKLQPGEQITVVSAHHPESSEELRLELLERDGEGIWAVQPDIRDDPPDVLERFGTVPLPPYIQRGLAQPEDFERYQTLYARRPGSVAAPTAGLHFTSELLEHCRLRGINQAFVTLHVGIGTFRPIAVQHLADHRMHAEWCEVPQSTADVLSATRHAGGRIVAVGTTTVRTLETMAASGRETCQPAARQRQGSLCDPVEPFMAWCGATDLFIRPPFQFEVIDVLLTNFHLPRSTLLVLVSTFAGRELIRHAYAEAVRERYRFFSYGDAMLIV